jgi:hypothetical protein
MRRRAVRIALLRLDSVALLHYGPERRGGPLPPPWPVISLRPDRATESAASGEGSPSLRGSLPAPVGVGIGHPSRMGHGRRRRTDPRGRSHAERLASRDGYFAPKSVIRTVGNSPLTPFLGGGPAVLLQVAHPLVAVGVVEHSDYRRDLWRRLARTLQALYLIAYGTKAEAERAADAVQAVHSRVHGRTNVQLGRFPPGTPYSASDPELMLWVHATLVEASLAVYQRFVRALSPDEQERYYQEMALVARLFGTPAAVIPRSLATFRDYFAAQLAGDDHGHPAGPGGGRRDPRRALASTSPPPPPRSPARNRRCPSPQAPTRIRAALELDPSARAPARRTRGTGRNDTRPVRRLATGSADPSARRLGRA